MTGVFAGAFAGSLIELVEIFAVALVVGRIAGWHNALVGVGTATMLTLGLSLAVGRGLTLIPVQIVELLAGVTLLAFGQVWLRGVVRYYAGRLPEHEDEDAVIARQLAGEGGRRWSAVAVATAFKSSLLEGFEIALVVVALAAAADAWGVAIAGAAVATLLVLTVALLFRNALNRIPVKPSKFVAAAMLMGFGVYWLGEGLGLDWWGGVWAIPYLCSLWAAGMALAVRLLRGLPKTRAASGIER